MTGGLLIEGSKRKSPSHALRYACLKRHRPRKHPRQNGPSARTRHRAAGLPHGVDPCGETENSARSSTTGLFSNTPFHSKQKASKPYATRRSIIPAGAASSNNQRRVAFETNGGSRKNTTPTQIDQHARPRPSRSLSIGRFQDPVFSDLPARRLHDACATDANSASVPAASQQ